MADIAVRDVPVDGALFFQALLDSDALDADDKTQVRHQLWALLRTRIDRYTQGDSSSVRTEMAEMLLQSVCWCIGAYLSRQGDAAALLRTQALAALFDHGVAVVKEDVARGREMLGALHKCGVGMPSRAYRDTVQNALPEFFARYDPDFFAAETPCTIDYPLHLPVPEVGGIAFVGAYMRRLMLETAFVRAFDTAAILRVMSAFGPEHDELLVGIFEPVLAGAIGLAMLGGDVRALSVTRRDREKLKHTLGGLDETALAYRVSRAVNAVCGMLGISDPAMAAYLRDVQAQFVPCLHRQLEIGDLRGVFVGEDGCCQ